MKKKTTKEEKIKKAKDLIKQIDVLQLEDEDLKEVIGGTYYTGIGGWGNGVVNLKN